MHHINNFSVKSSSNQDINDDGGSDTNTVIKSSNNASSAEASPRQVDSDGPASPVIITTRLGSSNSEQDTISDESGYSEESNPSAKDHADLDLDLADIVNIQDNVDNVEEEECDLTVKGVLISDFSPMEKLKYLQRSQSTQQRVPPVTTTTTHQLVPSQLQQQIVSSNNPPVSPAVVAAAINNPMNDIFQNKVPEFCINI